MSLKHFLGADCVGLGRLQCYAAATNGRNGLNKMIEIQVVKY